MSKSLALAKQLHEQLLPCAAAQLERLTRVSRKRFWGHTKLYYRVKKYDKSSETRVTIAQPGFRTVKLYSRLLGKQVPVSVTYAMLRHIEGMGGLDDYLLKTPDCKLFSDVASQLKWQLSNIAAQKGAQQVLESKADLAKLRTQRTIDMIQKSQQQA